MILSDKNLTFTEKLFLKYREFLKKLAKLHLLGKSNISFLFIPHNEEKVAKFTVSYYFLAFILTTITVLFILVIFYFTYFLLNIRQNQKMIELGNKEKIFFEHHNFMANDLDEIIENLESTYKDLDLIIWGKSSKARKFQITIDDNLEASFFSETKELKSNMHLYQNTVQQYKSLISKVHQLKYNFQNTIDYLETRESIFESMPRGRPLGPGIGLITSTFGNREDPFYVGVGEFHNGIDFASANGTPIYATAPGTIVDASGSDGGLGLHIVIEHENGFKTVYGHCSELFVKTGDIVKRGDIIGLVGSTGKATGSHLHYELRVGVDPAMNPQAFINID